VTEIRIDAASAARIDQHGREAYPHECCGALLGRDADVLDVIPLPNTTEEGPRRRFLVRPEDYRAAEIGAAARGLDLIGFYHSHPDHPARPSQYDLDHAWPNFFYVIVSVMDGSPLATTCWRLLDDRSRFEELPVAIESIENRRTRERRTREPENLRTREPDTGAL
jgi:proteasome lid subunit RPN8/RPN11